MYPISDDEFRQARTIDEQLTQDEAVRQRARDGFDSGRMRRVQQPCIADEFSWSAIWRYTRNHMWVWVLLLIMFVGAYLVFTI